MEDERAGLVRVEALLLLDVRLAVVQDLRRELHVARRVDAVHVAEGGGNREAAALDGRERLVHLIHLLGLRWAARGHKRSGHRGGARDGEEEKARRRRRRGGEGRGGGGEGRGGGEGEEEEEEKARRRAEAQACVYSLDESTSELSTPSSSPPVTPSSISSRMLHLAMRLRYSTQVPTFSSRGSSDRSSMCEEKSGSPATRAAAGQGRRRARGVARREARGLHEMQRRCKGRRGRTLFLEVLLVGLHEAVEPRQPRALAVIGVQDHRDAVLLGDRAGRERALRDMEARGQPCPGLRNKWAERVPA